MGMLRIVAAALLLAAVLPLDARAQDALVITPDELRPGLSEWIAHRESQGLSVAVAAPEEDVAALVRSRHGGSESRLRWLVLIGDVDAIPCAYRDAVAIAPYEEDDRIATDAPYADVDGDEVPDLAVGRIPARTADEARALLARSIAYEEAPPNGDWPRRLGILAGVGGFGAQQDMALEMLTRTVMNRDIPEGVATHMTYAKETSAFCPPPSRLQDLMLQALGEGALAVAYVGHGSARNVDRMTWGGKRWPILEADATARLACSTSAPLLIFVACSTGQYDAAEDSLAELSIRHPSGPAAVVASSRVSTPYGNGVLAVEMVDALYRGDDETAGGVLLTAKQQLLSTSGNAPSRQSVEALAGTFYEPDPEKRARDRQEHVYLYQLFGDPLLRLARPAAARVMPPPRMTAGETAKVALRSPVAGTAHLELVPRRDAFARPQKAGRTEEQMAMDHARANVAPLLTIEDEVAADEAAVLELPVPADVDPGRYVVRVWITGPDGTAMAGTTVRVVAPR
jgi:hypothetical protein